jgi:hypothetical protein
MHEGIAKNNKTLNIRTESLLGTDMDSIELKVKIG